MNTYLEIVKKWIAMANYQEIKNETEALQPGTRCFKRGICRIFVSPPFGECGWHLSISSSSRDPTWEEIRDAWYDLVPEAHKKNGAIFFPPKDEYINVHKYCFHIHEVPPDLKNCISLIQQSSH
jgi:hypothetical protein